MMEKTLILKHISGMLCLLISYSKFTRPMSAVDMLFCAEYNILKEPEQEKAYEMSLLQP